MLIKIFVEKTAQELEIVLNLFIKNNDCVIEDLIPFYIGTGFSVLLQYRKRIKV